MANHNELKHAINSLKQAVKQSVTRGMFSSDRRGDAINVAGRKNIVVSGNVGRGGRHIASSTQSVRIRQQDGETIEETESSGTTWNHD
jgi:hypothetical protein